MVYMVFRHYSPWFLRLFSIGNGFSPGSVVGIYENDEAAKTVTEIFSKAVEANGGDCA